MSNYHILQQDDGHNVVSVAFHIPVPAETNGAGKNLKDCIKQHLGPSSSVPWLQAGNPTEYAQVENGEVYEHVESIQFSNAHETVANKRAQLDAKWTSLNGADPDKIRTRYQWWGTDRNVG